MRPGSRQSASVESSTLSCGRRLFSHRFGKLLAAVTEKSRANEPYVSYKDTSDQSCYTHICCRPLTMRSSSAISAKCMQHVDSRCD